MSYSVNENETSKGIQELIEELREKGDLVNDFMTTQLSSIS